MRHKRDTALVNTILENYNGRNVGIRNMKLQKLLYFVSGVYAAENDGARIIDEDFQAWRYGPVLLDVYEEFRRFGANCVEGEAKYNGEEGVFYYKKGGSIDTVVDRVVRKVGNFNDIYLAEMTHITGAPWWQVAIGQRKNKGVIPFETIVDYFRKYGSYYAAPA